MRTTIATLLLVLFCPAVAAAGVVELIGNGTFDGDISGWTIPTAPDTTIEWDPGGVPGGSLRIESSWVASPGTPISVLSPCFAIQPGFYASSAEVRSRIRPLGSGFCNFDYLIYGNSSCSEAPISNTFDHGELDEVWESVGGYQIQLAASGGVAFRITMQMIKYPFDEVSTCWYDNVSLLGPPPPPSALEIPTAHPIGLVALGLLLAAAGGVLVARRWGGVVPPPVSSTTGGSTETPGSLRGGSTASSSRTVQRRPVKTA